MCYTINKKEEIDLILYYLIWICLGLLIGKAIGHFMVKGTKYLINKEYAKGTAYTLLTYVIIGLELLIFSSNNNVIIIFLIIYVCINIFGYVAIRNRIKGVR